MLAVATGVAAPESPAGVAVFSASLASALTFPMKGKGWAVVLGGAAFLWIAGLLAHVPFAGMGASLIGLVLSGYYAAYYLRVISSSARGEEDLPDWPDFRSFWDDIWVPLIQFLAPFVLCVILPMALGMNLPWMHQEELVGMKAFGAVEIWGYLGLLYLPMALLAVGMCQSLWAVSPHVVIPAIVRTLPDYLVVLLAWLVVVPAVSKLFAGALAPLLRLPFGDFLAAAVSLFFLLVQMRMLGLLYRRHRDHIGFG